MLDSSVLVLNQNYDPLNVCGIRRAVVLVLRGKAELLKDGRGEIRTSSRGFPIPSIIRLLAIVKRPIPQRRLTRREVFYRDKNTCQYCGRNSRQLTLDHVMPRHRGGQHVWENVVSACIPCNHRKAARTPQEAGMWLASEPRAPRPNPYYLFQYRTIREEWRPFIPWAG